MAYISTYDERYYGGFVSRSAGFLDAAYDLSANFVLAEGYAKMAYGATIPVLGVADKDTYSLGNLVPGIYTVRASNYTWDFFSNGFWFSTPTVQVANALGSTVGTGYFGTYSFTVYTTGTYYVSVIGSSFESGQYSLYYTYDSALPTISNVAATGNLVVLGTLKVGSIVSASGTYNDANGIAGVTPTIQWYSKSADSTNWVLIQGATSTNYTLSANELGKNIGFAINFTDNAGYPETLAAVATSVVIANQTNSAPTGTVAITGTAKQGQTLVASNNLSDADGLGVISYQWKADGVSIGNATSNSLALTQLLVGKTISVTATYVDNAGKTENVSSTSTGVVENLNDSPTGSVSIAGTLNQGQTLTALNTLADADGLGSISYQWKVDGVNLNGATSATLTLGQSHVGKVISVVASYIDGGGATETVSSSSTSAVANTNDAPSGSVSIAGVNKQGQTLTASNSLVDADGLGAISYQWKADGVNISGATNSTLVLGQSQVGKAITVSASYTDLFGASESVESSSTSKIEAVTSADTTPPVLSSLVIPTSINLSSSSTPEFVLKAEASDGGSGVKNVVVYFDKTITYAAINPSDTYNYSFIGMYGVLDDWTDGKSTQTFWLPASNSAGTLNVSKVVVTDVQGNANTYTTAQLNALGINTSVAITGGNADTTPPVLSSLVIPTSINLSSSATPEFVLKAEASDGGSGVKNVVVYFDKTITYAAINPSDTYNYSFIGMYGVLDDWTDGKSTQTFWLPASNSAGTLNVSKVVVTDVQGNANTYTTAQLNALGINTSVAITGGNADTTPPVLSSLVIPTSINLSSSATPEFVLKAEASDGGSGVKNVVVYFDKTITYAAINPSDTYNYSFIGMYGVLDDWTDGKSTQTFWLPASNSAGTLNVSKVVVTDVQGNANTYTTAQLKTLGINTSVALIDNSVVQKINASPTGSVTISGIAKQGVTLTAANTLADTDGLGTISYQWKADGVNISGATASTLTLAQAQVGKAISVVASYTDLGSTAESVSSIATSAVENLNDAPTGGVTISGTAKQGETLTATNTLADADGLGTISYQWKADGANITGATGVTLSLTQAQVGKTITAVASYTDGGGTAESVSSSATASVVSLPTGSTLTGQIYQWKSHTLLSSADVSLASLIAPVLPNNAKPVYELKDVDYNSATGEVTVGLWMNLSAGIKNFDVSLKNAEGQSLGFTANTSLFPAGWAVQSNADTAGGLTVGGFGDAVFTGTSVQLGTVSFKSNGASKNTQINFVDGSVGGVTAVAQQQLTPYAATVRQELSVTGGDGKYTINALEAGTYSLDVSKSLTALETGSAISSADALAALKIAVGRNPNIDGSAISPYQLIAADVNQDGKVTSADALAILKMAVKRSDAPTREWLFVSESQDFWDEAANNGQGGLTISRTNVTWNKDLQATVSQDTTVNILAVLKGDVNGSWTGATSGTQSLPNSYFSDLVKKGLGPLSTWGVVAA